MYIEWFMKDTQKKFVLVVRPLRGGGGTIYVYPSKVHCMHKDREMRKEPFFSKDIYFKID